MTKDEMMLKRRLLDLAMMADRRGVFSFTEFLGLNEQNLLHTMEKELSFVRCSLFGGYEGAERVMAMFAPCDAELLQAGSENEVFPIACIQIVPRQKGEEISFSHRDVLGSVLNLGLDRGRIGDILLREKDVLLLCHEANTGFVCEELSRIRHTPVSTKITESGSFSYTPKTRTIRDTVASERLDAVVSAAFEIARSEAMELIRRELVFVNGKQNTSPASRPKSGDVLSVRGHGKARYTGALGETKKGRIRIEIERYI